jgi:hypothetical protein
MERVGRTMDAARFDSMEMLEGLTNGSDEFRRASENACRPFDAMLHFCLFRSVML